jgi:hypothetical protein
MKLAHSAAQIRSGAWRYPCKVQFRVEVTRVNNTPNSSHPTSANVKEGYEEGMGRVLLSTRSFNPGDIVVTDKPLVQYTSIDDLVNQYDQMNKEERASIMDLKHLCKPEDAEYAECRDYMQEVWLYARHIAASEPFLRSWSHEDVFMLITCTILNAFGDGPDHSAMFPLLSRAAHSCSPNCVRIKNPSKHAYMATKPIAPGEMLTITYNKICQSTIERRTDLRSAVFFNFGSGAGTTHTPCRPLIFLG